MRLNLWLIAVILSLTILRAGCGRHDVPTTINEQFLSNLISATEQGRISWTPLNNGFSKEELRKIAAEEKEYPTVLNEKYKAYIDPRSIVVVEMDMGGDKVFEVMVYCDGSCISKTQFYDDKGCASARLPSDLEFVLRDRLGKIVMESLISPNMAKVSSSLEAMTRKVEAR